MTFTAQLREVLRETWKLLKRRPYLIAWPILLAAWLAHPPKQEPEWWT